jgi:integral membrane protein
MNKAIRNLRVIGILEGISYLVLLCIAMPMKYYLGMPEVVKIVGWCHGVLFMLYIPAVFLAWKPMQWSFIQFLMALAASLAPFGTFVLDKSLKQKEEHLKLMAGRP